MTLASETRRALVTPRELSVPDEFLRDVLTPYKPRCRYLQRARVVVGSNVPQIPTSRECALNAHGEFQIPESCYIADTGHFNAVEYNICYNQLAYTLLAACIEHQLLGALCSWSMEQYRQRQLPDFLIVDFTSEFRAPMQSARFEGFVGISKATTRRGTVFMKTISQFRDYQGGFSRGHALIAVLDRGARGAEQVAQ